MSGGNGKMHLCEDENLGVRMRLVERDIGALEARHISCSTSIMALIGHLREEMARYHGETHTMLQHVLDDVASLKRNGG